MAVIIHPHSHATQEHLRPSGHLLVWLWGLPWAWVVGVFLVTPPAFTPSYSHPSWKAVSEAGGAAVGRWIWRNLPITRKRTGCRLERCTTDGIHLSHFMQEWVRFKMTSTRVSESSRMASEFSLSLSLCSPLWDRGDRYRRRHTNVSCLHASLAPKTPRKSWGHYEVLHKTTLRAESQSNMVWFPCVTILRATDKYGLWWSTPHTASDLLSRRQAVAARGSY